MIGIKSNEIWKLVNYTGGTKNKHPETNDLPYQFDNKRLALLFACKYNYLCLNDATLDEFVAENGKFDFNEIISKTDE